MSNLLNPSFWFNQQPPMLTSFGVSIYVGLIAIFAITAIISYILKNRRTLYSKLWSKIFNYCISNGLIVAVLLFLAYELIPMLSARFWILLWGIPAIVWGLFIAKSSRNLPVRKQEIEAEKIYQKYLP